MAGDKRGYVDKTGKVVIAPHFDMALPFVEGLAEVKNADGCGFIDTTGKAVVPLGSIDDGAEQFSEGLANVKIGKKWGFVDKSGNLVIAAQFDYAFKFSEGLAAVGNGGK